MQSYIFSSIRTYGWGFDPFINPINLFPVIQNLIRGNIKELIIFGNDYPTKDGTFIRVYIHVTDIAQGHIITKNFSKIIALVETYEKTSGIQLNYRYGSRTKGDATIALPDCSKIIKGFGWIPKIRLEQM